MTIQVVSRTRAEGLVRSVSGKQDIGAVVSIYTPPESRFACFGAKTRPLSVPNGKPFLALSFDDASEPSAGVILPTADDVRRLLDWAKMDAVARVVDDPHRYLLIHCDAGISRSSACAIAILVLHGRDPHDAVKTVNAACAAGMWPNAEIISLADEALGCDWALVDAVEDFRTAAAARMY